jgi:hypothetical protein
MRGETNFPELCNTRREEIVLDKCRIALRHAVSSACLQSMTCNIDYDTILQAVVTHVSADFLHATPTPVVIDHYRVPATWRDAVKLAWNEWIETLSMPDWCRRRLKQKASTRLLPRLYQVLRICPHLDYPSTADHIRWMQVPTHASDVPADFPPIPNNCR